MERLIKDGKVILDGTLPQYEKEKQAFKKLEEIEELMECYNIEDLVELHRILYLSWCIADVKSWKKRSEEIFKITMDKLTSGEKEKT